MAGVYSEFEGIFARTLPLCAQGETAELLSFCLTSLVAELRVLSSLSYEFVGSIPLEWDETPVFSVIPVPPQVRFRSRRN